ncbi:MAG TPA: amidohydrolase [Microbacterium sp.]|uniref:amidohydrolase n=1 Tax=Microbacterium sp. TaxID=51671 RepID=UPI002B48F1A1|nr:amidohydrolase [Microbacterium sp.]HKT55777.1 amidohydrolase [Microbacterium sp.]
MTTETAVDLVIRTTSLLPSADADAAPGFVAVADGVIVALGEPDEADAWAAGAARVIDVGGATVMPGLIDAHIHPTLGGSIARGLDLSGIQTRAGVREALAAHAATTPHAVGEDWLVGWGLDPACFEGASFDNALFDGVLDDELVYVTLFDGHAALASEAALRLAGVTGREELEGASRVGLRADGSPSGMLFEMPASDLVMRHVPAPTFDERVDALEALLHGMAASGLVAGQMLDLEMDDSIALFEAVEARGDLGIRVRISPWVMPGFAEGRLEELLALQGRQGRSWHVQGIKLMIDGTIDNGTAWLFEPDSQGESTESLWLHPEEYVRVLEFFHGHDVPTTTHAIGDKGVSFVANAIAALPDGSAQHRIEHIETLPDTVLAEIVASGAATSLQPTHCTLYSKADHSDNWSQRLGDERADLAWRTGSLRDAGVIVALGSDWPIAPYDPRSIIADARLRRPVSRPDLAANHAEEALTARRTLDGYTSEWWRSVGEAGGRLEVGARADITVLGADPLTAAPEEVAAASVVLTLVDGRVSADFTA